MSDSQYMDHDQDFTLGSTFQLSEMEVCFVLFCSGQILVDSCSFCRCMLHGYARHFKLILLSNSC